MDTPPAMRNFDLGDVLSVTTGRLVSSRHMTGFHDVPGGNGKAGRG